MKKYLTLALISLFAMRICAQDMADVFDKPMMGKPMPGIVEGGTDGVPQPIYEAGVQLQKSVHSIIFGVGSGAVGTGLGYVFAESGNGGIATACLVAGGVAAIVFSVSALVHMSDAATHLKAVRIDSEGVSVDYGHTLKRKAARKPRKPKKQHKGLGDRVFGR